MDVCEHRGDLLPLQRVRCSHEGVGRHYDLSPQFKSANGYLQGDGRVAQANAVFRAGNLHDFLLEFPYQRPIVGEPPPLNDSFKPLEKTPGVADIRTANMQWFGKSRLSSGDSWRTHDILTPSTRCAAAVGFFDHVEHGRIGQTGARHLLSLEVFTAELVHHKARFPQLADETLP